MEPSWHWHEQVCWLSHLAPTNCLPCNNTVLSSLYRAVTSASGAHANAQCRQVLSLLAHLLREAPTVTREYTAATFSAVQPLLETKPGAKLRVAVLELLGELATSGLVRSVLCFVPSILFLFLRRFSFFRLSLLFAFYLLALALSYLSLALLLFCFTVVFDPRI